MPMFSKLVIVGINYATALNSASGTYTSRYIASAGWDKISRVPKNLPLAVLKPYPQYILLAFMSWHGYNTKISWRELCSSI